MQGLKSKFAVHYQNIESTVEPNLRALEWCDVANMRVQNERMDVIIFRQLEYAQQYGVDKTLLDSLNKEIIMHPGPINRGVEITSEVADSHQSVILNQVENG
jgi:aspartate carbamoyltransferase catalytic subunit